MFVATASIVEGVAVSACLGAAADIMNEEYLTDSGSILTAEARHSSYLRSALNEAPFAQPFDTPLTIDGFNGQSYAVLTGCNETVTDDTTAAGPAIIEVWILHPAARSNPPHPLRLRHLSYRVTSTSTSTAHLSLAVIPAYLDRKLQVYTFY